MQYPDEASLSSELKEIIAGKLGANVYRMLAHTPNVAPSFTAMADAVMWSETWPATWRELAIVRVGYLTNAPYEVHHHSAIGKAVGLTDDKLDAIVPGRDLSALDKQEQIIVRSTDALVKNQTLTDEELKQVMDFLDPNQLSDFVLTVGFYQMVANFLNTFRVEVEEGGL